MLWEALTVQRLFAGDNDVALLRQVLDKEIPSPRSVVPELPAALADLVMSGLRRDPAERIGSAQEYATTLEQIVGLTAAHEVARWVRGCAGDELAARARRVADVESIASVPTAVPVVGTTIPPLDAEARRR